MLLAGRVPLASLHSSTSFVIAHQFRDQTAVQFQNKLNLDVLDLIQSVQVYIRSNLALYRCQKVDVHSITHLLFTMTSNLETAVAPEHKDGAVLDIQAPRNDSSTATLIDAPLTWKTVVTGAIAAFAGIFLGYDSAVINGVLGMPYFIHEFTNKPYPSYQASLTELQEFVIPTRYKSLIVGLLAVGNLLGSCE